MTNDPILIIDDTPVNLRLTKILLVNEGYEVLTAASAEEGLEILKNHHPQLILVDIQLPGIDGLEFTRLVRQDARIPGHGTCCPSQGRLDLRDDYHIKVTGMGYRTSQRCF